MLHRLHSFWLLSGCWAGLLAGPAAAQTRILFIGNSFTHGNAAPVLNYNAVGITDENYGLPPNSPRYQADPAMPGPWGGVPGIFKKMTDQAGKAYDVHMEAVSAATLSYHYTNALSVVQQGPWDQVVLQENSIQPLPVARTGRPADFLNYATRLEQAVHAGSPAARVYLYQTWPRADMTYPAGQPYSGLPIDTMTRDLRRAYAYLAAHNSHFTAVAPVGDAWLRAMQAGIAAGNPYAPNPGQFSLWAPDNLHASKWGSYLAACVLFAQLTGLDPRLLGPTEQAAVALDITGPAAAALQQIAFQQVLAMAGPLPVVLTAFAAQRQAAGVRLHWATATEQQNARFDVQRSPDGVAFATIATVPGRGDSQQPTSYDLLDALAPSAVLYYRLRQVDVGGAATFSPVVAVGPAAASVSLYPNPAREQLFIAGPAATAYRVRNSLGQLLRQATMPAGQATVELAGLPGGLYQLELETATGRVRRTFVRE
ncbi:MAG: hypothetical protein JWP58_591 [Hymenobacter sp.]|nr:hypothetical protein [Hymenobacter sp.]